MNRLLVLLLVIAITGCGESETSAPASPPAPEGLSSEELEHGIGPIRSVDLADIDRALAAQGEELFRVKCSACHRMDERYVGPPLGDVTDTRSGAYIMNMMLNPDEMVQKHPEAKKKFAEYLTPMPNQHLSEEDARAVLEFLRVQSENR